MLGYYSMKNSKLGVLAAINQFNKNNKNLLIEKQRLLKNYRLFKNAKWLNHFFQVHILKHPSRTKNNNLKKQNVVLTNPYF